MNFTRLFTMVFFLGLVILIILGVTFAITLQWLGLYWVGAIALTMLETKSGLLFRITGGVSLLLPGMAGVIKALTFLGLTLGLQWWGIIALLLLPLIRRASWRRWNGQKVRPPLAEALLMIMGFMFISWVLFSPPF